MGCSAFKKMSTLEYIATQRNNELFPYIKCKCGDDLKIVEVSHLPYQLPRYRTVFISKTDQDTVSVLDGYRTMYSFENTKYFFANVKVERSDQMKFTTDVEAIKNSSKYIVESVGDDNIDYMNETIINGIKTTWYERKQIDIGGTVGTYTLFKESENLIVTVYLLNQRENNRRFTSIEEFKVLRNAFLDKLTKCINSKNTELPKEL